MMKDFASKYLIDGSELMTLLQALLVFVICYVAVKLLSRAIAKLLSKSKHLDPSLKSFLASAVKTMLWAIAVIIIASTLGINITSLVALLSVAGVALSLAVQGLLSNVFSGITLLASQPFAVGDRVTIGGHMGTVKSIGILNTCIVTLDSRLVYIPNGDITSGTIINETGNEKRRVDIRIETSYDNGTEEVIAALCEAAGASEHILKDPAPAAHLTGYMASNIEYTLYAWCESKDYYAALYELNENVRRSYEKHGIEISYDRLIVTQADKE